MDQTAIPIIQVNVHHSRQGIRAYYLDLKNTYPVLVDDIDNSSNLAGILTMANVDHAADLDELGERLGIKQRKVLSCGKLYLK